MNFVKKFNDLTSIRYFLAGLFIILSSIILQNYFLYEKNPVQVNKHFYTVLAKKEKRVTKILNDLIHNERELNNPSRIPNLVSFYTLYEKEGIAAFIYKKDSLVFWTTNSVLLHEKPMYQNGDSTRFMKLKNGWYEVIKRDDSLFAYVGLILIKNRYSFENNFLVNSFQKDFKIPDGTEINITSSTTHSSNKQGDQNFRLRLPGKIDLNESEVLLLFSLYMIGFLLIIISVYRIYCEIDFFVNRKWLMIICFTFDIVFLRFILFYFKIPGVIYDSTLFGPAYFSSSALLPSPGDFLINSLMGLIISYVIFLHFPVSLDFSRKNVIAKTGIGLGVLLLILTGFFICIRVIHELVTNSTIPLTLQNISVLNYFSIIAFIIIASVILSYLLLALRLLTVLFSIPEIRRILHFKTQSSIKFSGSTLVISLLIMSVVATLALNHNNDSIEKEKRKLLAVKLSIERDPFAEMMFSVREDDLLKDPMLNSFYPKDSSRQSRYTEDSLSFYLLKNYFGESWNNYNVQITVCQENKFLRIQPRNFLVDCETYFNDIIQDFGKPVSGQNLFYLDYGYGFMNYLVVIPIGKINAGVKQNDKVYVEISSKSGFRDQGYPELLIDKKSIVRPDLADYSYAFYRNGKLMHRVGYIHYSLDLDHAVTHGKGNAHFYIQNGMDNYCYPIDRNNVLIISKKAASILDRIAPFSYLFLLFGLFSLLFFSVVRWPSIYSASHLKFSERLQLSMIGILITSLLIIGFLVVYYLTLLNRNKNSENLSERTHSMLVEMQHKLGATENLSTGKPEDLNELLVKFSNVFFCDVNLYDPEGYLIASSRPQIFDEGLISKLMNNIAFDNLRYAHSSLYIHDETIGKLNYSSAYIPFFNDRNKLLGYLNLPYFAKQEELKREISTFLMAFINVYVFLIIVGFIIALVVSDYITRPLRLLTFGLGKLTLGKSNEKLEWHHDDEVGKLVAEYNRKIDELARSAEILAQSERESAWREMARQIAHEIKNPLTPMKLSVQYLQKSWDEKTADWEQRIRKFTETMIDQIDSLAFIASEFSDFAKMPDSHNERLDLNEIVRNAISLYGAAMPITLTFDADTHQNFIIADRKQVMRVFTNLLNNSIQAIGEEKQGRIDIRISTKAGKHFITVRDDGAGIMPEQAGKIFQPNFTTKTGGMGLGLAIVKNIIVNSGGEISFSSETGKGTVFMISLPVAD